MLELVGKTLLRGNFNHNHPPLISIGIVISIGIGIGISIGISFGIGISIGISFGIGISIDISTSIGISIGIGIGISCNIPTQRDTTGEFGKGQLSNYELDLQSVYCGIKPTWYSNHNYCLFIDNTGYLHSGGHMFCGLNYTST